MNTEPIWNPCILPVYSIITLELCFADIIQKQSGWIELNELRPCCNGDVNTKPWSMHMCNFGMNYMQRANKQRLAIEHPAWNMYKQFIWNLQTQWIDLDWWKSLYVNTTIVPFNGPHRRCCSSKPVKLQGEIYSRRKALISSLVFRAQRDYCRGLKGNFLHSVDIF